MISPPELTNGEALLVKVAPEDSLAWVILWQSE